MNCQTYEHPITRSFLHIIQGICRDHARARCDETLTPERLHIHLIVPMDDYRILVGSNGKCIKSINRLVERAGIAQRISAKFKMDDDGSDARSIYHQFVPNPKFSTVDFLNTLHDFMAIIGLRSTVTEAKIDQGGKLRVIIPTTNLADRDTMIDLNNLFFPYGFTQGQKIDIKTNG